MARPGVCSVDDEVIIGARVRPDRCDFVWNLFRGPRLAPRCGESVFRRIRRDGKKRIW